MTPRRFPRLLALALVLFAVACDTAEERAEGHYQRALGLVAEGDIDRAKVEFRNVFRLNGSHHRARLEYARLLRDEGSRGDALSQFLRLVEQDRHHPEGHRDLAALALQLGDFPTAETHAARAFALAPEDPMARALKATVDFRQGRQADAVKAAEAAVAEAPDALPAHLVLIADRMAAGDHAAALLRADSALQAVPEDEGLHLARLSVLEAAGDTAGAGAQLQAMADLFPGNRAVTRALVQWHLRENDPQAAETVLRAMAARTPDAPEGHFAVVQLLYETEGPDAARAELGTLIEGMANPLPFRKARAELDFATGRQEEALAGLQSLIEGEPASDEVREMEVTLATMLRALGRREEAAGRIESVLAADPTHVEALKRRAETHIDADRPEAAIADLRTALGQAPRDPEIMSIMATAHEREGARELAAERLSLAVELSGGGVPESLRYARHLLQDDRLRHAEDVLVAALRRAPENPEVLSALGSVHLARGNHSGARQVAAILRGTGTAAATEAAARLEVASLQGEGRTAETTAMLQGLAGSSGHPGANVAAWVDLVRAHVAAGDLEAATGEVDALLAKEPRSLPGQMMAAGLAAVRGNTDAAEAGYRTAIAAAPALPAPHEALVALLAGLGRQGEARQALAEGIAATEAHPQLLFAEANFLEADEDFEGAMAVYETLYAHDTGNLVIANNLASLLATHRTDETSLERAFAIARRLRGSEVPQFQDTFGWILSRRGDPEGALAYLEPAAAALPGDPMVQYHLGSTYLDVGRRDEARDAFARAVALAGDGSDLPQMVTARAHLAELAELGALPPASAPSGSASGG